jgi:hypothetical protein
MRWLWPLLLIVTVVFGASYAATIVHWMVGPWSGTAIEQDGRVVAMQFGQNLSRPDWLPVYPNASVAQASRLASADKPFGFHTLELATRASLDEVKRFYTRELVAAGFEVSDLGLMNLNPVTARLLGTDGSLVARRAATDDMVTIHIRTADGLIPSRMLQIHWAKISEYPAQAQAAPGGQL